MELKAVISEYTNTLATELKNFNWTPVEDLGKDLLEAWRSGANVFFCGNGGSAANANHLANDFIYGVSPKNKRGLNVNSLASNSAVMTCLGNDEGYGSIYEKQLNTLGKDGDVLIVLSGSGNSENIINVLRLAKEKKIKTHAILGFDGGVCKSIADNPIHLCVNDMQIAEDFQMIVGHILMKYLAKNEEV